MITITQKQFDLIKQRKALPKSLEAKKVSIIMPKAKAQKWLKALRSGEFIQTDSVLHNPLTGSFCCLGVEQYVNQKCVVETYNDEDPDSKFANLPSMDYLDRNGYVFIDEYGNVNDAEGGNPWLAKLNDSVASLNDEVEYIDAGNQHRSYTRQKHKHDFAAMADALEAHMAVY